MILTTKNPVEARKIKRPIVSDGDGMQLGGLAFAVALIGGMIAAAILAPGALTSFWVWFALLMMATVTASGVQRLFARQMQEGDE